MLKIIEVIKSLFICITRQSAYRIHMKASFDMLIHLVHVIRHVNCRTGSDCQGSINNCQLHDISSTRDFVCSIVFIEVLTVLVGKSLQTASSGSSLKSRVKNYWWHEITINLYHKAVCLSKMHQGQHLHSTILHLHHKTCKLQDKK
jgi:hypothetical protein